MLSDQMTDTTVNTMINKRNNSDDIGAAGLTQEAITSISRFKILQELGEGGMGKVYLAEDTQLHRKLVLKVLPKEIAANKTLIERFKREAQASAGLKHPNIVTVYELNRYQEGQYIAMEYIDGIALSDLLEERELSLNKVIDILIQLCRGLRAAHQAGIIHRDIKPANVMIDKDGWVKILDFGLAKLIGIRRLTRYGVRMGTIPYMSPEQLRGEDVDKRSDIFSLGVVFYQLITYQLPFKGETEDQVMYSISHNEPEPLARYKAGITDGLQRMIDKALDKDPGMRYQHVDDFLSDLKREKKYALARKPKAGRKKKSNPEDTIRIRAMDTENLGPKYGKLKMALAAALVCAVAAVIFAFSQTQAVPWLPGGLTDFITDISLRFEHPEGNPNPEFAAVLATRNVSQKMIELLGTTDARTLQRRLKLLRNQKRIAVGKAGVNAAKLEDCYVFITDSDAVLDVFLISDRQFHSLRSQMALSTLSGKYPGMQKTWVQDLRASAGAR